MASAGRYDAVAAGLADRHYSRQSVGDRQYMPPGRCVAFVHQDGGGAAAWTAVLNVFRSVVRWRNTLFRNESSELSSRLVAACTLATYQNWIEPYGALPDVRLTTEVDIDATRARRSTRHEPGHCYREAGWVEIARTPKAHGRPAKVVLAAPSFIALLIVAGGAA